MWKEQHSEGIDPSNLKPSNLKWENLVPKCKCGFYHQTTLGGNVQPELIEPMHHLQLMGVGHGAAY